MKGFKYDISILVLLYGKSLTQSKTIDSLKLISDMKNNSINIVIWNNGPKGIINCDLIEILREKYYNVELVETLENRALSKVYNDFISSYMSKRYMILDDDTSFGRNFFNDVLTSDVDNVLLPVIQSDGTYCGPMVNGNPVTPGYICGNYNNIEAIGSGLVVSEKIIIKLLETYSSVFDERFFLYGVDSTFFLRIEKLSLQKYVKVVSEIEHSLSRLESESETKIKFRLKERSYSRAMIIRYYYHMPYSILMATKLIIKNLLIKNRNIRLSSFIYGYFRGRHYRDR